VALAASGNAICTITNTLITGGGGPNPCAGLPNCQTATNPNPGGSATVNNGGITGNCQGMGSIAVGRYASNPVGPTPFLAASFFDVKVASGSACTIVTIQDCDLAGASLIQWWNPKANNGVGGWLPVSNQSFSPGPPPCITMVLNAGTSPSLNDLTGTVFAGQILIMPNILPPQVFQNPFALGAVLQGSRPSTPVPPSVAAPSATTTASPIASAPAMQIPALKPPNTGDGGLRSPGRGVQIEASLLIALVVGVILTRVLRLYR